MNLADKFSTACPGVFFLDADRPDTLTDWLIDAGWLEGGVSVTALAKAGEGNMNLVLRATLDDGRSVIVKQARPWVEKFPEIPAPAARAAVEGEYLARTAAQPDIAAHSPALLHMDAEAGMLVMEDLGSAGDLTSLYKPGEQIDVATLRGLLAYASSLHGRFTRERCDFYIENADMRALNAEHIFRFPFAADNGMDLDAITDGLSALAIAVREDAALMEQVRALHGRYMDNGDTLLHGDFYPGSCLQSADGVKVIDSEFCFFGDAEFDVGVLMAHLMMTQQSDAVIDALQADYAAPAGFSEALCRQYAGVEILRRLLGLAQLPLSLDLAAKTALIERARVMLTGGG